MEASDFCPSLNTPSLRGSKTCQSPEQLLTDLEGHLGRDNARLACPIALPTQCAAHVSLPPLRFVQW